MPIIHKPIAGPEGPEGPEGPAGEQGLQGPINWANQFTITLTPGIPASNGRIALNALPAEVSTMMYVSYVPGMNVGVYAVRFRNVPIGSTLILQDKDDETKWGKWVTTGAPVDYPAQRYVGLPIAFVAKSTTALDAQVGILFVTK